MPKSHPPRLSDQLLPQIRERFARIQTDPGCGARLLEKALDQFNTHAGWESYHAFISTHLPPGNYLLAGPGPASRALVATLQAAASPVQIIGVISLGRHLTAFPDCPVFSLQEALQAEVAGVLICQPASEAQSMDRLLEAGFAPSRIHHIGRQAGFRAAHDRWLEDQCAIILASIRKTQPKVDHVILTPNLDLWMVVEEDVLQTVLPPETTLRLHYGPSGKMGESSVYPTYDTGQCLPLILRLLEELRPRSLYLRGSAQFKNEHVGAAIRAVCPEAFMVFEVYDYACMLENLFLETWGYSSDLAEDVRDAEVYLALHADLVIDKTPGQEWNRETQQLFETPRRAYAPTLGVRWEEPEFAALPEGDLIRVLCAGSMPYFHNYVPGVGYPHWAYQNIIEPMAVLSKAPGFFIDIFNASHDPEADQWPAFQGYAELFDPERVAYHPRVPLTRIRAIAPTYDFGMFLFSASEVLVDYPLQQSLPNRCMSYIAGDLPLLVNTEMRYLASLVEDFHAGLTLASTDIAELPRRLREADVESLRAGARALRRHLVTQNHQALETFRTCLSKHQQRIG